MPILAPSLTAAEDFLTLQVSLVNYIRKLLRRLFELSEQVAAKEINHDPVAFLQRETINRLSLKAAEPMTPPPEAAHRPAQS